MKIAFYSDTYLPNRDGVVTSILSFRKGLEREGHEVYVFASASGKARKENADDHAFLYMSTPFRPYPQYNIALFPFLSERKVKSLGIDIVHSHGMATMGLAAVRAARSLGVPVVGTFHTLIPRATHYISGGVKPVSDAAEQVAWKYLKWYYNQCDVATAPTKVIAEMMAEHGIRNARAVPNGIDTKRFTPDARGDVVRDEWNMAGKKIVLSLGRIVIEKNLELLINSALMVLEQEPEARFVIAGVGPAANYYKEYAKKCGVEKYFVFKGLIDNALVPSCFAAADVVAVPSKFETQGLVTLEAMASGGVVAGADYLATKEIIRHGVNGYLFDPDDPADCAEKLVEAMRSGGKVRGNARKTAEKYSLEACTKKLEALYGELL